ncbi:MAG: DNA gyrase inhibitor YacG [Vicinamibacterales bacterium]
MHAMTRVEVCVFCRKRPVDERWRPFCSERCKLLDLAAWADGSYRVPGPPLPAPVDTETPDEN